jgi:RNA polymerase sigma factor (sigma-70 family)
VESDAVESNELLDRLSRIGTHLQTYLEAHAGAGSAAVRARQRLLLRYYGAVYRYLLSMLRDPVAAEELTQDFAVRMLRGDFKHFDPERGRFRDFVKTAVRNLVLDHWRKRGKNAAPLQADDSDLAVETPPEAMLDQTFVEKWKEELFSRTWEALEQSDRETGQPYYIMLRCRTDAPALGSAELAERVGARIGKHLSLDNTRQLLRRARKRFAELLVDEVGRSLDTTEPDRVAEELIELGLMGYCRPVVPLSQP